MISVWVHWLQRSSEYCRPKVHQKTGILNATSSDDVKNGFQIQATYNAESGGHFHAIGEASFLSRENSQLFKTCCLIFPLLKFYLEVNFGFPRSRFADQMESGPNIQGYESTIAVSICFT
jgi:hypothetical protein